MSVHAPKVFAKVSPVILTLVAKLKTLLEKADFEVQGNFAILDTSAELLTQSHLDVDNPPQLRWTISKVDP